MNTLDDPKWNEMQGGYRVPYDPRSAIRAIEFGSNIQPAWDELWENLYHQGDVGEASYAVFPILVRIHADQNRLDWNLYALAAAVDLARDSDRNPPLPDWLKSDYDATWKALFALGLKQLPLAKDRIFVHSAIAVIAIAKGLRDWGRMMIELDESEFAEICQQQFGIS